jgi:hypothetical protein
MKKEQKIIVICKLKQKIDMFLFIFTQTEKEGIELMASLRSEQLSTVEIWLPIVQRNLTEWIRSNSDGEGLTTRNTIARKNLEGLV